jgi:hypothetical protein
VPDDEILQLDSSQHCSTTMALSHALAKLGEYPCYPQIQERHRSILQVAWERKAKALV